MTKNILPSIVVGIRFEVVVVTPALAIEWLKRNFENNRTINKAAVARFAEDMKKGAWKVSHQGIAFDEKGRLIDGQHRLEAIRQSGVTTSMVVSYYGEASPLETFDRGTGRTPGDVLDVSGAFSKGHGKAVVSVVNMMTCLISGATVRSISTDRILEVYKHHGPGIDFACSLLRPGKLTSPFAAALAYTHPICPQRIESLFLQAINSEGLSLNSGAWHLNRLMRERGSTTSQERLTNAQGAVKCAFLHLKDREVKVFKVSVEGSIDGMAWAEAERVKLGLCAGLTP